jgi:hypothetical protein
VRPRRRRGRRSAGNHRAQNGLFANQRPHHRAWIKANRRSHIQKFQHIKASVPALVLRHVRWGLPQAIRHHRLSKRCRLSPGNKQFAQLSVAFGVDGLGQFGSSPLWLPIKIALVDSPKMGETRPSGGLPCAASIKAGVWSFGCETAVTSWGLHNPPTPRIRSSFRRLAKKLHPEPNTGDAKAASWGASACGQK